jgi:L-fuconolactonase
MTVLDAQVHIWEAPRSDRPWIPGGEQLAHTAQPLTAEALLAEMDRVGVDRALLVGPSWEGARNDVVLRAAQVHPDRFGAIMRFTLNEAANAEYFDTWVADPHVFGIRTIFYREATDWLADGTADWVWREAERTGLPVTIYAPGQFAAIAEVARRHPALKLTIDHLGLDIHLRDDAIVPEIERMLALAEHANVAVKATSLPSFITEPFPFGAATRLMRDIVGAFGAERVFWGSDLSRLSCTYDDLYRFAREELTFLAEGERKKLIGDAACEWFSWTAR